MVLYNKQTEHLIHNTMLKPYTRSYISINDLLSPVGHPESTSTANISVNLVEKVGYEKDVRFAESRQREYNCIVDKDGAKVDNRADLLRNPNFVGTRFALCFKDPVTPAQQFKARWILQRHHDHHLYNSANGAPMHMRMSF